MINQILLLGFDLHSLQFFQGRRAPDVPIGRSGMGTAQYSRQHTFCRGENLIKSTREVRYFANS